MSNLEKVNLEKLTEKEQIEYYEKKLERTQLELTVLQIDYSHLESKKNDLEHKNDDLDDEIHDLVDENNDLENEVSRLKNEIYDLEQELKLGQKEKKKLKKLIEALEIERETIYEYLDDFGSIIELLIDNTSALQNDFGDLVCRREDIDEKLEEFNEGGEE